MINDRIRKKGYSAFFSGAEILASVLNDEQLCCVSLGGIGTYKHEYLLSYEIDQFYSSSVDDTAGNIRKPAVQTFWLICIETSRLHPENTWSPFGLVREDRASPTDIVSPAQDRVI